MVAHPRGEGHPRATRRLSRPRPVAVEAAAGVPVSVGRVPVDTVREEWRVRERWWTEEPVRRRYFEVLLASGENVVVFLDEENGRWYRQRA